ncbi:MAG: molybdopterin-synthase adenylyltransferase MoeB [Alphaproteobacteria bacterium]|nr:molybdopterin-synthase adenylyltransferase MoeB [Alphaproteobacteria bacterium]
MTTDDLDDDELHRYARQLILPSFDEDHQLTLKSAHALVIGAGGLGAPVLQYLAAAGLGTITIMDDDTIDLTNLNRQVIHTTPRLGQNKVNSAKTSLMALNPLIRINAISARFSADTPAETLDEVTVIIDASDNPDTRLAANQAAHNHGVPLVFGGAVRMEGQVASFRSGVDKTAPCYRCLFPGHAGAELAPGCSEAGILGPVTGVIGSIMALEAIKQILAPDTVLGERLDGKLLLYDGFNLMTTVINVTKQVDCPTCGDG